MRGLAQGGMEGAVRRRQAAPLVAAAGFLLDQVAQRLDIGLACPFRREGGCRPFQHLAQRIEFQHLLLVELGDDDAPPGSDRQQPFGGQPL